MRTTLGGADKRLDGSGRARVEQRRGAVRCETTPCSTVEETLGALVVSPGRLKAAGNK